MKTQTLRKKFSSEKANPTWVGLIRNSKRGNLKNYLLVFSPLCAVCCTLLHLEREDFFVEGLNVFVNKSIQNHDNGCGFFSQRAISSARVCTQTRMEDSVGTTKVRSHTVGCFQFQLARK